MKSLQAIETELDINYKKRKLKKEHEAIGKIKRDPKYFYKYANKFVKTKNRVGPLTNEKGDTVKDEYQMAEILRQQYESTFSKPDAEEIIGDLFRLPEEEDNGNEEDDEGGDEEEDEEGQDEEGGEDWIRDVMTDQENYIIGERELDQSEMPLNLFDAPFDYMDIVEAINQLSESSGPGPDGISAILLKKAKISIALMLQNIFYNSLEKSEIPDILKTGFICPILKPNSKRDRAASWRPVSLTSHVMKTMERVIWRHIVNHLELNNLMNQDQHGSRRKMSCLSQLLEHHDEILRILEENGNVDVIYTDFEKAYEKVDHKKLIEKMETKYRITGKLKMWLQDFLKNRVQKVLIHETLSEESQVVSGAVQGSVLGPIFFLMFIGDITDDTTANTKLFVDDAKVKSKIEKEEDVVALQANLDTLYKWEETNKMKFNGSKFQLLRYGTNEEIKNNTVYFTGHMEDIIDQFSSIRDLGVIMTDDGRFDGHIEKVVKKVRQKIGWILRTFYTRRTDILKQLWKSLVQCHIDYCSQLYMPGSARGMHDIEKLFL